MPMSDKAKEYADKAKPLADKAKPLADKAKQYAGKAKGAADSAVEKYSDKIPDPVGNAYNKASGAVGKVLPGDEPRIDTETVAADVDVAAAEGDSTS